FGLGREYLPAYASFAVALAESATGAVVELGGQFDEVLALADAAEQRLGEFAGGRARSVRGLIDENVLPVDAIGLRVLLAVAGVVVGNLGVADMTEVRFDTAAEVLHGHEITLPPALHHIQGHTALLHESGKLLSVFDVVVIHERLQPALLELLVGYFSKLLDELGSLW